MNSTFAIMNELYYFTPQPVFRRIEVRNNRCMVMPSRIGQTRYSPQDLTKTVSQSQAVTVYEGVIVLGQSDNGGRTCSADLGHGQHVLHLSLNLSVIRLALSAVRVIFCIFLP